MQIASPRVALHTRLVWALAVSSFAGPHLGCKKADLEGAKAEVAESKIKLDLPPVPELKAPEPNADGSHSVTEMRLVGEKYLDTDVKVKGYVIWIYDCAVALRTPQMTDAELKKLLEDHPEKCERPNILLGETPDAAATQAIAVVELPRAVREDEKKTLPKEEVELRDATFKAMQPFKQGDQVIVSGKWALMSPKGFRDTEGLLVYAGLENLTAPAPATVAK